jgi:hypothetical protein
LDLKGGLTMDCNLWEIRNDETGEEVFTRDFNAIEMIVFGSMTDDNFNQMLLEGETAITIIGEIAKLEHGDSDEFYGVIVAAYNESELSEGELIKIGKVV